MGNVRVLSGFASLASISHLSNPCSFRDMTVLMIFSKIFQKHRFQKNSKTIKISTLLLDTVRILSRVANIASDYGCSNPRSFRDMTFFGLFSSEKLDLKKFTKFEIPSLL